MRWTEEGMGLEAGVLLKSYKLRMRLLKKVMVRRRRR
jgi:hypothetical protein